MQSVYSIERQMYDPIPTVLLDYSGSVMSRFAGNKTVLEHLIELMKEISEQDNFTEVDLVLWSDDASDAKRTKVADINFDYVKKNATIQSRGTMIVPALQRFGDRDPILKIFGDRDPIQKIGEADDNNLITRLYVFTDGEISDDDTELYNIISRIHRFQESIELRMIVLESNDKNYFIDDCAVGNRLVRAVRDNSMNNFLKYIFFFNRRYPSLGVRFVNLYNANLPNGYIQYDDKCFHLRNYPVFLANITEEITTLRTQIVDDEIDVNAMNIPKEDMLEEEDIDVRRNNRNNPAMGKLEKIGYNLIKTIKDLEAASSDNKKFNKRQVIDFFCNLIGVNDIADFLKRELIYGVDNKTFQEYKDRRAKLFSGTQLGMYQNLQSTLCDGGSPLHYTSFVHDDRVVYDIEAIDIEHSINIGIREYKHSAVYDQKRRRLVPIIPIQNLASAKIKQGLRQWIRAIYSRRYGIPASSDLIHYTFLIDNMYVQLSELPEHIKEAYKHIVSVMFCRARYGEDIKEVDYLRKGERPKPIGSQESFEAFLSRCPNYPRLLNSNGEPFDPMTVWFMILLSVDDYFHLIISQEGFCKNLAKDGLVNDTYQNYRLEQTSKRKGKKLGNGVNINSELVDTIKTIFKKNSQDKLFNITCQQLKVDEKTVVPNYYCFVTLNDTTDTGGYMLYKHINRENHKNICRPNYVISEEAYNVYMKGKTSLKCPYCAEEMEMSRMIQIEPKDEYDQRVDVIKNEGMKKRIYRNVEVYDNFDKELINLNELDFTNNYTHKVFFKEHVVLGSTMDSYSVMRFNTTDKQAEFNERVPKFLFKINWDNVVVAGGMCRSILLGQKIQDIDIFFVGLDFEEIKDRMITLINDIVTSLQLEDPGYRFILMYKPLNSVIELLCTKSTFDENTINEDEDDINIDEKFLFINNEIVHKVQIILRVNKDIEEIFENFDIYPSCVAFDGETTYLSEGSYVAYKFMVNIVDKKKASHASYNHRAIKYYKYGFSIALDKKQLKPEVVKLIEKSPKIITIGGCVFEPSGAANVRLDDNDQNTNDGFRYIPLENFCIAKNKSNNNIEQHSLESTHPVPDRAMYESYDALDANMIGLYNYMTKEGIRYCYVMGTIDKYQVIDTINVDEIEFLCSKRSTEYDWYNSDNILVSR